MIKKITALLLCISAAFGNICAMAEDNGGYDMTVMRSDSFEEYETGIICVGSKAYPLDGENAEKGVSSQDGGTFKELRSDNSGGFALSLNDGVDGNLVETKGADGNTTKAVQIIRRKGTSITSAKLALNPLANIKSSKLIYSVDIRNGGKSGTKPEDAGYTYSVNNYFGSLSLLGFTLDFNDKSLIFESSSSSAPPVGKKTVGRVLPSNGEWFNLKAEIDVMSDKITVYINGKAVGEQVYGRKFRNISSSDMTISLAESKYEENAIYFDNINIEKSSVTADELERIYNNDAFETLGKNVMVFYPGSSKVYFGEKVEYFSSLPFQTDEKIYAPIRGCAELFGYEVSWNGTDKSVILSGEKNIVCNVNSGEITVNNENSKNGDVIFTGGVTYAELNTFADIFGLSAFSDSSGLAMLLEADGKKPSAETVNSIIALYPEASLGFEIDGGWYTEADLLKAAGTSSVDDLGVTFGVNGRIKNESYETLRNGIKRSTEHVKSGKYSGKWDRHHYYPTVMASGVPTDWTQYNALSFWLYSETATNEHITVGAVSNPHDSYSEYKTNEHTTNFLYAEIYIDFTGWKQFIIPLDEFKKSTEQVMGFQKIDGLYFYTRAFEYEPYPQTVLYIDDVRLETLSEAEKSKSAETYNAPLEERDARLVADKDYVLTVPEIYKKVSLLDYGYILDCKKEIENGGDAKAASDKLNGIYKKYGITNDNYKYSDLVVKGNIDLVKDEDISIDKTNFNHSFPEVVEQPAEGRLYTQAYFKEARAVTGYNPKFLPGETNSWGDFKFIWCASHAIEYADYEGKWHFYDYGMQINKFAREKLDLVDYKVRTSGFYDETKLRFDNDGDAYATIMLQGTRSDGTSYLAGVLCHSRDNLKTFDFYVLPRPFSKMEILDGHNEDCLNGPPVIMLHNYWSNADDQRGSFVIPEKQADGTLVIPEETLYSDEPVVCTSQHSGKSNFCQTLGNKIFIVYASADSVTEDHSQAAEKKAESHVPAGHQMWSLLRGELSQYMVTSVGVPTYIIEYDKETKKFSEPVFLATAGSEYWDGHNWPAISLDSENKINVLILGHHFPLLYTKSKNAGDISEWEPLEVVSSGISYASMNIDSNDTIYAVTRNSNDGYTFDLCLQKKEKGGEWEESRIVKYWKQYYMVWGDDVYMDPKTDALYVFFKSKTNWTELFADDWAAKDFIFPESSTMFNVYPIGTNYMTERRYGNSGSEPRGEHTAMVSYDYGKTWKMAVTEDYMPVK